MIKIKKIFEDRKWRKKYNSMKLVFEELLEDVDIEMQPIAIRRTAR